MIWLLAPALVLCNALAGPGERPPNVVFILADDLGWRDTAVYGSRFYETPHIDALAKRGMRFTNAYAASPTCSPTRASILTGLHPARIGMTAPDGHLEEAILEKTLRKKAPVNRPALEAESVTRLGLEHFTLAEAFKAAGYRTGHFGKWHVGREPYDPLRQGFDVDIPHTQESSVATFGPWPFWPGKGAKGEHIEDRTAAEASAFMRENRDRPFFLNYWAFSVHAPIRGKPELVEKYRKRAAPDGPQRNPVNAAMIETLDDAVGTLVGAIDELGLADRTIIIFFSDNGGMVHRFEGGAPVTSNAPLRSGKSSIHEGGIREPLIVVWPDVTKPGSRSKQVVQSVDFYPTLLEMAGIAPRRGLAFDGISIVPALRRDKLDREAVFFHVPHYAPATLQRPATSVRRGRWKLIRFHCDGPGQADRHELYNLRRDIGETKDLAAKKPRRVAELSALIDRFLKATGGVVPKPNPEYVDGLDPFPEGPKLRGVSRSPGPSRTD